MTAHMSSPIHWYHGMVTACGGRRNGGEGDAALLVRAAAGGSRRYRKRTPGEKGKRRG